MNNMESKGIFMKLPIKFLGQAKTLEGIKAPWSAESGGNKVTCSVPVEFDGPGHGFSPEDLFLQSLMGCFIGTIKVYATHSKIRFSEIHVEAVLTVDKNSDNQIVMKHVLLKIYSKGVEQQERFKSLAQKVMKSGFILNSVKTEIDYEILFEEMQEI